MSCADKAVSAFAEAGADYTDLRTKSELLAAWLEADLGRTATAESRARGVLARYESVEEGAAPDRRKEAAAVLEYLGRAVEGRCLPCPALPRAKLWRTGGGGRETPGPPRTAAGRSPYSTPISSGDASRPPR